MPRPRDKEREALRRMYVVAFYTFLGLWLLGAVYLELWPPTARDKACLGKPLLEMRHCMWAFDHKVAP